MSPRRVPPTVLIVAILLAVFAAELIFRFTRTLLKQLQPPVVATSGGLAILVLLAIVVVAVTVLAIIWILLGLRGATVFATVIAAWELTQLISVRDLIAWLTAPLAVMVIVLVWSPSSRRFASLAQTKRRHGPVRTLASDGGRP